MPCTHAVGSSLCRGGSGGRALLLLVPLAPTSASARPLFSTLLPLATSVLRLPLLLPGLVSARGAPPTQCQVTCVSDNLSQGGPGGPRAADWSAGGWRGSGRGREADQLFPELHNNKRTRTGRLPPGQPPQRRSRARRSYLSARRAARLT